MRVALAYSGGLDTSVAAAWLAKERGDEVVCVAVDVGQRLDRNELRGRAAAAGAELRIVDARAEFVTGYCWPGLHANALYEGKYPLVSALARPLIGAKVVDVALEVGASAVAHGCTGKGNDQVRFEATFAALAPDLAILAPVRENAVSREEARSLADQWGIPISHEATVYSVDENLWGRTVECGALEDPWAEPPSDAFALTTDPAHAPDLPRDVVVTFEDGIPVALDEEELEPAELLARLTDIGGRHGFGRVDMIENRLVGIKSRELYEVPAALALIAAHRDLEDLTLEREVAHEKAGLERRWAELAYYGQWHGPLHESLRAFMASTQEGVSGDVRLRFHKGSCRVVGRRSNRALYDLSLATYEAAGDRFDHRHAEGFVRLWSLPLRTWALRRRGASPGGSPTPERRPVEVSASESPEPEPVGAAAVPAETPLWSGRFTRAPSTAARAFTRSIGFDLRLAPHDVRATIAHAEALHEAGLLEEEEASDLAKELQLIAEEIEAGRFAFSEADEDVHSAIERALIERLGPTGAKIHAGRSRNDLVVADLRLWAVEAAGGLAEKAAALAEALADVAQDNRGAVMPGYTHLQRAQPILLAHHLLAHAFPLLRDVERLLRARDAADVSPLGAGALAGSTLAIDPDSIARRLGFSRTFENSIDAVSDRDFALEFLSASVALAVHLSRLAEDVVLWSTEEFGFARVDEGQVTGSSMMPHKRNPDVAELTRGKAGRVLGDLVTLVTVMKGLPLAYNRDLQEDKEALFDAADNLNAALLAMIDLVGSLAFAHERMREAASSGFLEATDLAEYLVGRGMPFRDAHRLVGQAVAQLEKEGRDPADLSVEEWRTHSPAFDGELPPLTPDAAVDRRTTPGGTSGPSVDRQLAAIRARLVSFPFRQS
ncbi:MAG: argininosuccinate lyase [Actinomycetota bacterium]